MYALLADLLVGLHLAVVVLVVAIPILAIAGRLRAWSWTRNPWLRFGHLAVIAYIVVNAAQGELCFLTLWEGDLRQAAGQTADEVSFIGGLLHDILFLDVPQATLDRYYLGFGVVVLLVTIFAPPRRPTLPKPAPKD
ncbi:MAG: DUF2784 domain-containing protein [Planctomycetota bacterium]|nr:DUF2784 domain-containing protein [Planctomycetota bacterium]